MGLTMDDQKIRILIVDDQALFAHLLRTVLETRSGEFSVIGIAHNGREALDMSPVLKPDVILLDLSMPELDGVQTAKELIRRKDPARIMVLTTFDEPGPIRDVLGLGVGGYILKDCEPQELFASIRAVYGGSTSLSPSVINKLVHGGGVNPELGGQLKNFPGLDRAEIATRMNRREQEILALLAEGLTNKEISTRLFVAEQTVKNNISAMYEKMGIHDRGKLVKLAEEFVGIQTKN